MNQTEQQPGLEGIAIIGMSGRFPGAKNVDQFWRNLVNGVESISLFREDELEFSIATEAAKAQGQKFIGARAVLDDVDLFDAAFFGIHPREAEVMDPQHRFFLECAWETLESAGYDPEAYPGLIGVYAGLSLNTYLLYNLSGDGSLAANFAGNYQVGEYQTMLGNDKDFLPTRVSYIEAHGTGTPLGDPIEVAALTQAFRNGGATHNGYCAIGTCKTNISHLDVAAGATGLIKTVLQFQHGQIPPLLHFEPPNPKIDFANSPFYPVTKLLEWKRGETPRRAGVSAFGVGGTNAHVVVEETPPIETRAPERGPYLIILSAKTETALDAMSRNLAAHLEQNPGINLADVSFTLQMGRRAFDHRRMLFALNVADAVAMLRSPDAARAFASHVTPCLATPATGNETAAELAQRWLRGEAVDWSPLHAEKKRRRLPLPTYPFERKRFWVEPPRHRQVAVAACESAAHTESSREATLVPQPAAVQVDSLPAVPRKQTLVAELKKLLTEMSGQDLSGVDAGASFFDLGFDSLFLTQVGLAFRNKFGIKITFRQLLENLSSIDAVADYLDAQLPPEKFAPKSVTHAVVAATASVPGAQPVPSGSVLDQMSSQLAEMMKQLETLRSGGVPATAPATKPEPALPKIEPEPKRFGPYKPIDKTSAASGFTAQQQSHLDALIERYAAKTPRSKELTQRHRAQFADPRAVAGFRPFWKEMGYPIVAERSLGSRIWDIDGNEYVDVTMGFGTNLLGHSPPFVTEAVAAQLQRGVEVGPSSKIAGEVAALFCELTGNGRVGIHDDFFELGGDSLLGLRIVNQLRELLGGHVSLVVIFEAPTVAALAELLEKNYAEAVDRIGGAPKIINEFPDRINAAKVAQMRQLIGTVPPAIPSNGAGKNPRVIFILSPMRSGSTLFRIMLAGHPALFASPELQLLAFNTLAERASACEGYDKYMLEGTIRAIMEIKGCGMEQAQAEMQKLERDGWSIRKFYRRMQDWIAPRTLVDKTPDYAMDIEILRRAELDFENAFYLHLTRHPLGMIRSYEKGRFILESPYRHRHNFSARKMAELTWLVSHENILQFLAGVPRERQHRVKFEELVGSPQPALEGVCKAIGLEFHPAMLQPYEDGKKKMTDGIHPLSQQVGDHNFQKHQAVRAEVAASWREEYTADFPGEITWQIAKVLGYENPFAGEGARPNNLAPIKPVSREARRVKRIAI